MKRLMILALAICLMLPLFSVTALAAAEVDSGTCGDNLTWVLTEDGTLTISGSGDMYDYSFGETPWHSYANQITKLEIGDQVTSIGDNAFYLFGALTEITIPCGVIEMGNSAFAWCYNLEKVILGANLTDIDSYAFYGCQSLTGITIPKSVDYIGAKIFHECVNLTEIRFLGHVRNIYKNAFEGVTATAYYPANFTRWTENTLLDYDGDLTWIPYEGVVEELGRGQCGDNLSWILTDDGIMEISGTGDMYDYEVESPWQADAYQIIQLKLGEGVTSIGAKAFGDCYDLQEVTIHGGITSIGDRAFWGCFNMRNLTLCEGVQTIAEGAFMGCFSLLRIDIPDSVESIGALAFYGCTSPYFLESNLSETLPLGEHPVDFMISSDDTLGLRRAFIGKGVSYIGTEAFGNCQQLVSIRVDSENPWFSNDEQGVLFDKAQTTLLQAPGGITGAYTIPETVTTVGDWAMSACPNLTGVTIPGNVTKIGDYAFAAHGRVVFDYSTVLEEIRFLGDAPEIGVDAFWDQVSNVYYPCNNATWTEDVRENYGGGVIWVPYGEAEEETLVKWYSGTTSLNGTIDLNIYVLLSENLVNADDTYVRFTYADKVVDVPMAEALYSPTGDYTNRYRFSCPIYAKQLADSVNVKFMKGEEMIGTELNYSVKQYCENQIKKSPDEKLVALCKALLNYGAAAQQLLNYNTENLANASLSEADKVLYDVDASDYKYSVTGSEEGIKAKSATLMLEDVVKVRVYFTLTGDKPIEDYTITIDGKTVTPSYNEKGWYVETDGIPGKDLEKMFKVQVGGITVEYGALSFVNSKVGGSNVLESNISKALHAYYAAAEALLSPVNPTDPAAELTIKDSALTLGVNGNYRIDYTYSGDKSKLTWSSSDPAVATVDQWGMVKAVAVGSTIIQVTDGKTTVSVPVSVTDSEFAYWPAHFITVEENTTIRISSNYNGSDNLTWISRDPNVVTVSGNGKTCDITATGTGATTIVVTDGVLSAAIDVLISSKNVLKIDQKSLALIKGQTAALTATYTGSGTLTWMSTNPSETAVSGDGNICIVTGNTPEDMRNAIIVTDGNYYASVSVLTSGNTDERVYSDNINIISTDGPFYDGVSDFVNDYVWVVFRVNGEATNKDIYATSSDPSVVSVSEASTGISNGCAFNLNFESVGSAVITVISADGAVIQKYTIHVKDDYECAHGGGLHTPEQWAECATSIACENGMGTREDMNGWLLLTMKPEKLTFDRAIQYGQGFVHANWGNGWRNCRYEYVGMDESGNCLFYEWFG